jgi:hypothetical protein
MITVHCAFVVHGLILRQLFINSVICHFLSVLFSVCGIPEARRHGMETWRYGDMETWRLRD